MPWRLCIGLLCSSCADLALSLYACLHCVFAVRHSCTSLVFLFLPPKCCDHADRDSLAAGLLRNCPASHSFLPSFDQRGRLKGGKPPRMTMNPATSSAVWLATHRAEELFVGCTLLCFLYVCPRIRLFVCFLGGLYSVGIVPKHKHTRVFVPLKSCDWYRKEGRKSRCCRI